MRRHLLLIAVYVAIGGALGIASRASAQALLPDAGGVTLYNGITLPSPWPPRPSALPSTPVTPAYLVSPPAVIPIDVGRQLFVDDFLVSDSTLKRTFHHATYYPGNPVLKPDQPWEGRMAMPYSDGVWYDPSDHLYKMWYLSSNLQATCYATSTDGIAWQKPSLDVQPGTNVVQRVENQRDSSTVWLDLEEKDPRKRFKMFRSGPGGSTVPGDYGLATFFSPDGIHWSAPPLLTGSDGDRSTVFWNPFRKVWVYSLRQGWGQPRSRRYWEMPNPASGPQWQSISDPPFWTGADSLDPMRSDLQVPPQLYNLDGVAYESLILGLFTIWRGQPVDRQKPNDVVLGFSRDGWSWSRPDRATFLPVDETPGTWNHSNVQSAGGGCLIVGDQLYFYVSGRAGVTGSTSQGTTSAGLAMLRRDGFASMDAGPVEGTLTTRPVRFNGRYLFVNVAAPAGSLRVEVLDADGKVLPSYSYADSIPIQADRTLQAVHWKNGQDLSALAGKPIHFRFYLTSGQLYAFWVSPDKSGASHGYVAAGGPTFTGPTDTVGDNSLSTTIPPPVDVTPPAVPSGLQAAAGDARVTLSWTPNVEPDLAGYNVYVSNSQADGYVRLNPTVLSQPPYQANGLIDGATYYFEVSAVDGAGNESKLSAPVSATPVLSIPPPITPPPSGSSTLALRLITLSPNILVEGDVADGTVTLNGPAPEGGVMVTLVSSNSGGASGPDSVMVPAGSTTAIFAMTSYSVANPTTVTVNGTYRTTHAAAMMTVLPALASVSIIPANIPGGDSAQGMVTLNLPAPAGGATVTLESSNGYACTVQPSVTVPPGETTASFPVTTYSLGYPLNVTLIASYAGARAMGSFVVGPAQPSLLGDLNRDRKVTLADAMLLLQIAVGRIEPTPDQLKIGDLNGDGKIDITDVVLILRKMVGL